MSSLKSSPKPLRVSREAVDRLKDAASWIGRLNGTDDPTGQAELREEVQKARAALAEIETAVGED